MGYEEGGRRAGPADLGCSELVPVGEEGVTRSRELNELKGKGGWGTTSVCNAGSIAGGELVPSWFEGLGTRWGGTSWARGRAGEEDSAQKENKHQRR